MRPWLISVAIACSAVPALAQEAPASLDVSFSGLETGQGNVMLALFNSEANYNGEGAPLRSVMLSATGSVAKTILEGLPRGRYAIKAFYDQNGNGKLDTNPFGMPTERFAFSNNAKGAMGPAKWADASFDIAGTTSRQLIAFR